MKLNTLFLSRNVNGINKGSNNTDRLKIKSNLLVIRI